MALKSDLFPQAYVRLRQRYIVRGEVSVNEWHEHFMLQTNKRRNGAGSKTFSPVRPQPSTFQTVVNNLTAGIGEDDDVSISIPSLCPAAASQYLIAPNQMPRRPT